jgi:ribosomal protein L4
MKATLYDVSGKKKGDVTLPALFDAHVREDLAAKAAEAAKQWQAMSTYAEAGKRHSAAGTISHKRHDWKGQYGKGISRVPRKNMSRRGSQFNWVGAETSGTRGGRRSHPPKGARYFRKINKKEQILALHSALAEESSHRERSEEELAIP